MSILKKLWPFVSRKYHEAEIAAEQEKAFNVLQATIKNERATNERLLKEQREKIRGLDELIRVRAEKSRDLGYTVRFCVGVDQDILHLVPRGQMRDFFAECAAGEIEQQIKNLELIVP